VILLGVLTAGCGQSSSQRPAVAAYLKRVQRIEVALAGPIGVVTHTGNQFALEQGTRARALGHFLALTPGQPLVQAAAQIRALRTRLAAIRTPAPATRLRALLLELCDRQARMTDELAKLVVFLPRFSAVMTPFPPAVVRLERALAVQSAYGAAAVASAYASKAAALRQFQGTLQRIIGQLRGLLVPAVSKPAYEAQLHALQGMSTSAGRLAGALADGPQGNVGQLVAAFDRAATSTQTRAAQRAQIAAVRAYDAQSAKLSQLSDMIEVERSRLDRTAS
jgi:hypothetical protein